MCIINLNLIAQCGIKQARSQECFFGARAPLAEGLGDLRKTPIFITYL